MELEFSTQSALSMAILFSFLYFINSFRLKYDRMKITIDKQLPPEPKGALPFIGHLHLLACSPLIHRTFARMADLYGPIFTLKVGVHRALIVSSWEVAKDCLHTNDKAFVDRPKTISMEVMGYNHAIFGFSPYGPYWRELRKIAIQELYSNQRIQMLKPIRVSEVRMAIKATYDQWVIEHDNASDKVVMTELKNWFGDITMNVALRMVVGKRLSELDVTSHGGSREAFMEFFDLLQVLQVSDSLPSLRWLDIGGHEKLMKKAATRMDSILQEILEEHKRKLESKNDQHDFMDALLSVVDGSNPHLPLEKSDIIIKSTCLSLLLGGADTTTVTLTWALSLLLNNRRVLKQAQEELDEHVGRERQVNESDIKNLVYLQAVVKETMRLYPPGAILVPRESVIDCIVAGYHVPAGTRLLINLWKMQRDPRVWPNALEFQPERFLTSHQDVDIQGKNFELLPFGSGRRMCLAVNFSLQLIQFTLASLLHGFDISTPLDEPVDMTESSGMSNIKATPLLVCVSPRLPALVYSQID